MYDTPPTMIRSGLDKLCDPGHEEQEIEEVLDSRLRRGHLEYLMTIAEALVCFV